jgi:lipopolysaccharide/colanic/teichoic acid biosynthesis glycosyltransferase
MDVLVSGAGLLVLAVPLALIAGLVKLDSSGPVFFRQERCGRNGRIFRIHKFRTMVVNAPALGPAVTIGRDPRITRVGAWLRQHKLDELPQLLDVLRGEMSLVGPRPEVPRYVELWTEEQRRLVLSVRPGITDPASLEFVDEAQVLARYPDPEAAYREIVLPRKAEIYTQYVRGQSLFRDLQLIWLTVMKLLRRAAHQ